MVGTAAILAVGLVYPVVFKPYDRGHAPAGDAHLLGAEADRTPPSHAATGGQLVQSQLTVHQRQTT